MNSLLFVDRPLPWMKSCGITDSTLGWLQTASLMPEDSLDEYLCDHVEEEGDRASILNALEYAKDKGYLPSGDTPELNIN